MRRVRVLFNAQQCCVVAAPVGPPLSLAAQEVGAGKGRGHVGRLGTALRMQPVQLLAHVKLMLPAQLRQQS